MHRRSTAQAPTIDVLIVDDHPIAREGLRQMLASCDFIHIAGEAANGVEAIARVVELRPDVVLMDIRMPGPSGLEVTRQIKAELPATSVIIVTSYDDEALLADSIWAGANGYLLKDTSRELLQHAIRAAAAGGMPFGPDLLFRALEANSPY
jgi:DNA-binding NarL/FixJ family response regulator